MNGKILFGEHRSKPADHLNLSADRSDNGIDLVRSVTNGRYIYSRNFMPFMPEARYIRYMEIGEIKQQMRKDLAEDHLDRLQRSIFEARPPEFLFDIEQDPWETNNLAGNPQYHALLEKMRGELKKEVLQSRDILFLPEYELGLLPDSTTPYKFRLTDKNYPVKEIYAAASLSGFRGKDITAQQVRLLNDPNKIVRYWGIMGLCSQATDDLKPYFQEIKKAMNDDYSPVVITASAVAYRISGDKQAEMTLKEYSASPNMDLSLMALNDLLYLDNKKPFVETVRAVHDMQGRTYNVKAACLDFLGSLGLVPNNPDYRE